MKIIYAIVLVLAVLAGLGITAQAENKPPRASNLRADCNVYLDAVDHSDGKMFASQMPHYFGCVDYVEGVMSAMQDQSERADIKGWQVEARAALVDLVTNGDTNRDSNGRFAPTGGGGSTHALMQTPVVHAQMTSLYKQSSSSFMGQDKFEHSFTVDANGAPSAITSNHSNSKNTVTVNKDENGKTTDQAIVHTHPKGMDAKPSPADIAVAKEVGIPNYSMSRDELWVANPDGTTAKVGDVSWKNNEVSIKWKG